MPFEVSFEDFFEDDTANLIRRNDQDKWARKLVVRRGHEEIDFYIKIIALVTVINFLISRDMICYQDNSARIFLSGLWFNKYFENL